MALLPHAYQTLVRLASCMPFAQAAEILCAILGVRVSAATVRRQCEQAGGASLQVQQEQAQPLASCPEEPPGERMVMSSDGAYVPKVLGEWGEVKLLAIGQAPVPASHEADSRRAARGAHHTGVLFCATGRCADVWRSSQCRDPAAWH